MMIGTLVAVECIKPGVTHWRPDTIFVGWFLYVCMAGFMIWGFPFICVFIYCFHQIWLDQMRYRKAFLLSFISQAILVTIMARFIHPL